MIRRGNSGEVPVLVGSDVIEGTAGTGDTLSLPAGSAAGDIYVIGAHGRGSFNSFTTTLDSAISSLGSMPAWNEGAVEGSLLVYMGTLSSADITDGSIDVTWSGHSEGGIAVAIYRIPDALSLGTTAQVAQTSSTGAITLSSSFAAADAYALMAVAGAGSGTGLNLGHTGFSFDVNLEDQQMAMGVALLELGSGPTGDATCDDTGTAQALNTFYGEIS